MSENETETVGPVTETVGPPKSAGFESAQRVKGPAPKFASGEAEARWLKAERPSLAEIEPSSERGYTVADVKKVEG